MEFLSKLIIGVLGAFAVVWTVVEYLAIPVVLVVIGLICGFGWEYYVISLVVYVLLVLILLELFFFFALYYAVKQFFQFLFYHRPSCLLKHFVR